MMTPPSDLRRRSEATTTSEPTPTRPARLAAAALCLLVALFVAAGIAGLDSLPRVNPDEPWVTAPGHSFWTTGVYGTDLLRGHHGAERRFFGSMPLFPLLAGASLALFGLGLVQVRLVALAFAVTTLLLTYALGRRLFSPWHGLVAAVVLATWSIAAPSPSHLTGIPLVDAGRLARYDQPVATFGLAGLLALWPVLARLVPPSAGRAALAGLLFGLATLCHAYGAAWLLVGLALLAWPGPSGRARLAIALLAGFAAALAPWAAYAAGDWAATRGQYLVQASRVAFLDPRFYADNLLQEWRRYVPLAAAVAGGQVGVWVWAVAALAGMWRLLVEARRTRAARAVLLLVAVAVVVGSYATFLRPPLFHYLAPLWPLLSLCAAVALLDTPGGAGGRAVRLALLAAGLAATAEGALAYGRLQDRAGTSTSYTALCARLRGVVPPGTRLAALPHYWFGLRPHVADYRSLYVPLTQARPELTFVPTTFAAAMDAHPPEIVLIDPPLRELIEQAHVPAQRFHWLAVEVRDYLAARGCLTATFTDASYGRFEVYDLRPARCGG